MQLGHCKLHGGESPLVRSHIIPKAFFHALGKPTNKIKILSSSPTELPKRAPIGAYDSFLCADCENLFNAWDAYATSFLLNGSNFKVEIHDAGGLCGYRVSNFDYAKLKLFGLSVLWRASVCKNPFFNNVSLGEVHEPIIRDLILNKQPGAYDKYPVVLFKFDERPASKTISNPIMLRTKSRVNFYKFYMGGFTLMTIVDQQQDQAVLKLALNPARDLLIASEIYSQSPEYVSARKVAKLWPKAAE
jgi:hypothetical protein